MPLVTRLFIRISFVYLILGLLLGALLAAQTYFQITLPALFPVYIHVLVVGWLSSLIFGVVYWMFPKFSVQKPRNNEPLAWFTLIALNLGLLLRAISEPMISGSSTSIWKIILIVSATLQWLSGVAFVINTWGRVKER